MNKIKDFINKYRVKPNKGKRKKDAFDLSMRDLGRASRKLVKRIIVKSIKEW